MIGFKRFLAEVHDKRGWGGLYNHRAVDTITAHVSRMSPENRENWEKRRAEVTDLLGLGRDANDMEVYQVVKGVAKQQGKRVTFAAMWKDPAHFLDPAYMHPGTSDILDVTRNKFVDPEDKEFEPPKPLEPKLDKKWVPPQFRGRNVPGGAGKPQVIKAKPIEIPKSNYDPSKAKRPIIHLKPKNK